LGAGELKQFEVTAVHRVEIAGGDGDTHKRDGGFKMTDDRGQMDDD
jgi:hypothetical protein